MSGDDTTLINPGDPSDRKKFTYDRSYWSFDGFTEDEKGRTVADPCKGARYCDQDRIFNDLGSTMLDHAFKGFNTTLFSYGQTGSGKSYSIIGYGANQGQLTLHHPAILKLKSCIWVFR